MVGQTPEEVKPPVPAVREFEWRALEGKTKKALEKSIKARFKSALEQGYEVEQMLIPVDGGELTIVSTIYLPRTQAMIAKGIIEKLEEKQKDFPPKDKKEYACRGGTLGPSPTRDPFTPLQPKEISWFDQGITILSRPLGKNS